MAAFERDADWPRIEAVQRRIADSDPVRAVAMGQLVIDMPAEIGARELDRLRLTVLGLSFCEDAAGLLSIFVATIRLAAAA